MKISCSPEEKELLKEAIPSAYCVFDFFETEKCKGYRNCQECLEENVEWDITEKTHSE